MSTETWPEMACPECVAGKHRNCDGTAWDFDNDEGAVCPCWAASGARAGGPCLAGEPEPPSFTCPECGATSYHPKDIEHGYCGRCHKFTGGKT